MKEDMTNVCSTCAWDCSVNAATLDWWAATRFVEGIPHRETWCFSSWMVKSRAEVKRKLNYNGQIQEPALPAVSG